MNPTIFKNVEDGSSWRFAVINFGVLPAAIASATMVLAIFVAVVSIAAPCLALAARALAEPTTQGVMTNQSAMIFQLVATSGFWSALFAGRFATSLKARNYYRDTKPADGITDPNNRTQRRLQDI